MCGYTSAWRNVRVDRGGVVKWSTLRCLEAVTWPDLQWRRDVGKDWEREFSYFFNEGGKTKHV